MPSLFHNKLFINVCLHIQSNPFLTNSIVLRKVVVVSVVRIMWTRPAKRENINNTVAGVGSYDSTPCWSEIGFSAPSFLLLALFYI